MRAAACVWVAALAAATLSTDVAAAPVRALASGAPPVSEDHISYGAQRRKEMAGYSRRHYGDHEWRLEDHDAVVLHFTGSDSYAAAWNTFDSDAANLGELPGVCAHYAVKQSGTIAELVPPRIRCRHTIGLNHRSVGIEMVQATGRGSHWADQQILHRHPQIRSALRLVGWLQDRYGIATTNVIGHAMANDSPLFEDRQGWRNDHSDWLKRDMREFRRRLRRH